MEQSMERGGSLKQEEGPPSSLPLGESEESTSGAQIRMCLS